MVGPSRPQFVLFGSSVVQMSYNVGGWGAMLADLYSRKADILLRGYSGWNTRMALQVLDKVFPKDAAIQPSLVIVHFGDNDATTPHPSGLGSYVPLPEYLENMKKIISHIKSLSDKTRILCLTSPPVIDEQIRKTFGPIFADRARKNDDSRIYSEALVVLCKQLDVRSINLWRAIPERHDSFIDGMHLSSKGCKIVLTEILRVLKNVDWEPSLYWFYIPIEFPEDSQYYDVRPDGKTTNNVSGYVEDWQKQWVIIY